MSVKLALRQQIKMLIQNGILPLVYRLHSRGAVEPGLVVFADAHHNELPESMALLAAALTGGAGADAAIPLHIEQLYLDYGTAPAGAIWRHMMTFMRLYARASCVVICDNFLPAASCRRREETLVVQLWHACGAFKKFGYDAPDDIPAHYHGHVYRNTSLVTVSAPACRAPFAGAMRLPEEHIEALGVSRTDRYFSPAWREACRRAFEEAYPGVLGRKKVVLWAPTFRGNAGEPTLPPLDLQALQRQLGEDWFVIASLHPHMCKDQPLTTAQLCMVTDVLIADYSSLIFEYLLLNRPLVLFVPDLAEYREKRGFYLDVEEIPAALVTTETELSAAVCSATADERAAAFLEKYMASCDGHATERIAERIRRHCR